MLNNKKLNNRKLALATAVVGVMWSGASYADNILSNSGFDNLVVPWSLYTQAPDATAAARADNGRA